MYHQHQGHSDLFSPRAAFPQDRHLFLQGGNVTGESGLVLSTDAKPRLKWTPELHQRFIEAVNQLGGAEKATPKTVMRLMGIPGLTLYHLKSHLQKYRLSKNLQAQANIATTKNVIGCVAAADRTPGQSGLIVSNTSATCEAEKTMQISEALQMQIEVQRQLHEQLEVQRHLQLRIEAQGKYLQAVLEKAQETLGKQNLTSSGLEAAKIKLSEQVPEVSNEFLNNGFPNSEEITNISILGAQAIQLADCSRRDLVYQTVKFERDTNILPVHLKGQTENGGNKNNSQSKQKERENEKFYLEQQLNYKRPAVQHMAGNGSNDFGLACFGAQLDLNAHDNNDSDSSNKEFDLNGLSWS
uniref:HTH myb-type domain-containing protein n=1 Tax=Ananas comosus var. bracteatus TaxID=296719 RepID=A0A6V7NFW2_ANACO|nr:unnamed protein product [Ananas comosus var. bracteatus]